MNKTQEKIKKERQNLTNQIIENLEKEGSIWKKGWNSELLTPYNPTNGTNYKGYNRVKLMMAAEDCRSTDPRWMTYKQAQEKGWQVKKGSKGVSCEYWKFEKEVKEKDSEGNEVIKKEKLKIPFGNSFTLFNGVDIDGIPELPKREKMESGELRFINDTLIKSSECEINEMATDRAFYRPSEDKIYIPLRDSFKKPQEFTATLIHEMAHSTGHGSRLNREKGKSFGDELYAKEELRAELSSVFTQNSLNLELDTTIDNHSAYIKSWIQVLKNDPNEISRAAADAEKISDRLITNYRETEKEKIQELIETPLKKDPFKGLVIRHHYSEASSELGIEDNTTLRGYRAYKYLEKVIALDKKIYLQNNSQDSKDSFYKIKFSFKLGEYEKDNNEAVRYDLGSGEFGSHTKVSSAIKFRFNEHLEALNNQKEYWSSKYNISDKEFDKELQNMESDIEKMVKNLESKELKNQKQKQPKTLGKIVYPNKSKPREKNMDLEL